MRSMSRMKIFLVTLSVRHVRPFTTSLVVARSCLHGDDLIGAVFMRGERNCRGQSPARDEAVRVNACEKARKILVVYSWSGERIKVSVLEELDEIEYITPGQVVGKRLR